MPDSAKIPRRSCKQDRINALLAKFEEWMKQGDTAEEALARFTPAQYDFLVDNDIDFDSLILTPEQQKAAKAVTKAQRTVKPGGYNKKYPQEKQDLYNSIMAHIQSMGAEVTPRAKPNFRDLDFTFQGTVYRIVLSNPRS